LTVGGAASLLLGSMILVDSPSPELQLSLRVVLPVVAAFVVIAALLVRMAIGAQRQPPVTGDSGMLGAAGEALTPIGPDAPGRVSTRGELWRAVSSDPIPEGARVRITGVDGLTLTVRKE
jgi:membrane-bound serine protease (ClpP class)